MLKNLFSNFTNKDQKIIPSSEPIDGKIMYTFQNGLVAYQEELNLDQDEKLTGILVGFDLNAFSLENSIKDLIETIIKEKALLRVLKIILLPESEQSDLDDSLKGLKNSELQKVFNDFFSLNPTVINWLKTIGKDLTSLRQTPSTSNSSTQ